MSLLDRHAGSHVMVKVEITPALLLAVASHFLTACLTCQFLVSDLDGSTADRGLDALNPFKVTQHSSLPFSRTEALSGAWFFSLPAILVLPMAALYAGFK